LDQEHFVEKTLHPLLEECENGERAVFFVDAAHFVFGSFVCKLWCRTRQWVRAASGRQRHNVLGALHALTKRVTTVVNDSYITAETVCDLLRKLRSQQVEGPRKLTVVLDNAKYQTCQLVRECAQGCQIDLCFLPTYSPNLNLIERFWKYVKKKCLYGRSHENFSTFSTAIDDCITRASDDEKTLSSLLSPKFQTFMNAQLYSA